MSNAKRRRLAKEAARKVTQEAARRRGVPTPAYRLALDTIAGKTLAGNRAERRAKGLR